MVRQKGQLTEEADLRFFCEPFGSVFLHEILPDVQSGEECLYAFAFSGCPCDPVARIIHEYLEDITIAGISEYQAQPGAASWSRGHGFGIKFETASRRIVTDHSHGGSVDFNQQRRHRTGAAQRYEDVAVRVRVNPPQMPPVLTLDPIACRRQFVPDLSRGNHPAYPNSCCE